MSKSLYCTMVCLGCDQYKVKTLCGSHQIFLFRFAQVALFSALFQHCAKTKTSPLSISVNFCLKSNVNIPVSRPVNVFEIAKRISKF